MKLPRIYLDPDRIELDHEFWINDHQIIKDLEKIFELNVGQKLIIYNGVEEHDRLYKIVDLDENGIKLELITQFQ